MKSERPLWSSEYLLLITAVSSGNVLVLQIHCLGAAFFPSLSNTPCGAGPVCGTMLCAVPCWLAKKHNEVKSVLTATDVLLLEDSSQEDWRAGLNHLGSEKDVRWVVCCRRMNYLPKQRGLADWFWLWISHGVAAKMSANAAEVRRLNWGWRTPFPAQSAVPGKARFLPGCRSETSAPYHLGSSTGQAWQLYSPGSGPRAGRGHVSCIAWLWKWHTITSAIFSWTHRPTLVQCGRNHTRQEHQEGGSLGGISGVCHHRWHILVSGELREFSFSSSQLLPLKRPAQIGRAALQNKIMSTFILRHVTWLFFLVIFKCKKHRY